MSYTLSLQLLTRLGFTRVPATLAIPQLIVWENKAAGRRLILHQQAGHISFFQLTAAGEAQRLANADAPPDEPTFRQQLAALNWL